MEIQILHPLAIQLEPRLDVCVFRITCGGIRISLLDFSRASPIDVREHRLKRDAKKGALRSAPAAPVRQRLGELEDFTRDFHFFFCAPAIKHAVAASLRSEEHTSELQSPMYLVCR